MEARDFVEALIGKGLTQSDIAERTGIPQPSISKVSRGKEGGGVDDVLSRNYRKLQALHEEVFGRERVEASPPVDPSAPFTEGQPSGLDNSDTPRCKKPARNLMAGGERAEDHAASGFGDEEVAAAVGHLVGR